MAKQIITRLIDDLDGTEADETVHFSYDGVDYAIDLSTRNATKLRKELAEFATHATKISPTQHRRATAAALHTTQQGRKAIREWAHQSGLYPDVTNRGRIPHYVVEDYRRTNGIR